MDLYLISNQTDKNIKEPSLPRIDFFMEYIDVSDESAVTELAIKSGLDKNAFNFLLSGIDIEVLQEGFDPNEIEYFDAKQVLSAIDKFISLHSEQSDYSKEINEFLEHCINNNLKVCSYYAY